MYLYSYTSTHDIFGLAAGGASEQLEVRLRMTIERTQRNTWWWLCGELRDALGGRNRASLKMHMEAEIV
jgi:hypothetical protein